MEFDRVQTGLTRCCQKLPTSMRHGNVGLLMNQASVDENLRLACDVLAPVLGSRLKKLFSPQHGFWGEEQANMIVSPHRQYKPLELPIYSLYSDTRRPTPEMLSGLDCLVIDLQDVGTRVYTFAWTMLECLYACAEAGVRVTILDRPNPLGRDTIEGPILRPQYLSFVGNSPIPMRHGLTMGELARLFVMEMKISVDLQVVDVLNAYPYEGSWDRSFPWIPPSPNMPRLETVVLYPGQVLLEGTNLSEGRGTTYPFEVVGAPFLNSHALAAELNRQDFPGVCVRPVRFRPVFDKWAGEVCEGVRLHVTDFPAVRCFELTVAILQAVQQLAPGKFEWLEPPYEYEYERAPIDILYGSDRLRMNLKEETSESLSSCDKELWRARIEMIKTL